MKIRNGFVSNSSSSSFTCDVCGETYSGWDACLSEAEMYECENGHTFCESEAHSPTLEASVASYVERCETRVKNAKSNYEWAKKNYSEDDDYVQGRADAIVEAEKTYAEVLENKDNTDEEFWEDILSDPFDDRYEVPSCYCPICQMETITDNMAAAYMRRKFGVTYEEMKEEIRTRFKSYSELCAFTSGE